MITHIISNNKAIQAAPAPGLAVQVVPLRSDRRLHAPIIYIYIYIYREREREIADGIGTPDPNPNPLANWCL